MCITNYKRHFMFKNIFHIVCYVINLSSRFFTLRCSLGNVMNDIKAMSFNIIVYNFNHSY